MKRILIFILVLAMLVLSACDGGNTDTGKGGGTQSGTQGGSSGNTNIGGSGSQGGSSGGHENTGGLLYDTDKHRDTDSNGLCDDCNESVIATFDLYNLNDLHGKVSDSTTQPGIDELTTYLKAAKDKNSNTLILSSGDM